jgi:predicted dehydrogenase
VIRLAVIGFGHWGPNLVRNFFVPGRAEVGVVCDHDAAKLALAAERHPGVRTTSDSAQAIGSPDIDAVVIATPARSHFDIAMTALASGKHVLVSKPMTETSAQAERLVAEAARRRLTLMVDHTFVHTGAVRALRALVHAGRLGELYAYESTRVNLGLFRRDVDVLWDLAIHDLAIIDHVFGLKVLAVSATGARPIQGWPHGLAHLTLFLPGDAVAHVNVSWLAPAKLRQITIAGSDGMIVYDDQQPIEKLRIHDKGVTLGPPAEGGRLDYRQGGVTAPALDLREALAIEAEHFIDCIETDATPISDGAMGLRMIGLLEQASLSMRDRGRPIELV